MARSNPKGSFLDEEAAVRAVIEAVEDGLTRMQLMADRILLRRLPTSRDQRFLAEMEQALVNVADDLADGEVYGGRYGRLLEQAYRKGAILGTGGELINVDAKTIQTALWPARMQIKDLTAEGSRSITELTARSMIAGWSDRELSERIQDEVVLAAPGEGGPYSVPEWRAELQARNEPMKVYRQAALPDAEQGTLLEMIGPDDERTNGDICSTYLGKTMTLAEWEAAGADPMGYGFHPS